MNAPRWRRWAIAMLVAALLTLWSAGPASAHVVIDQVTPRGDGSVDILLAFEHGCSGAPTTGLHVTLPAGSIPIDAGEPKGWQHQIDGTTLDFEGRPLPDKQRWEFIVTARIRAGIGDTVLVPVQQTCADGTVNTWTDPAEDAEMPAPRFIATTATVDSTPDATRPASGAGPAGVALAIGAFLAATTIGARVHVRRLGPARSRHRRGG